MKRFIVLALLFVSCSVYAEDFQDLKISRKDSVQGFKFAVPVGENKTAVIEGQVAFDITGAKITAHDVIVRYYQNGKLQSTLKADKIIYSKADKSLVAEGHVKVKTVQEALGVMQNDE